MDFDIENERIRIGNLIREIRESKGISQVKLAEMTGLKMQNISRVELGKYNTGQDILGKIAQALGKQLSII